MKDPTDDMINPFVGAAMFVRCLPASVTGAHLSTASAPAGKILTIETTQVNKLLTILYYLCD
jgi:hypothetical protein